MVPSSIYNVALAGVARICRDRVGFLNHPIHFSASRMVNKRKADSTMERAAKKQSSASVPATGNTYPSPEVVPLSKSMAIPLTLTVLNSNRILTAESFTGCVDKTRIRVLREGNIARQGPVVYWMSRDQRVR